MSAEYKLPECSLADDFRLLYENNKLSDVNINVCGKEFKAHKAVLAARSPVFLAMFEHGMQESKLNQVKITDIEPDVFEETMRFVYTGESPNLEKMAEDLLVAADKYQLERLKDMCGKTLCNNLSIDNAARILILADRHSVTQMKSQAIDFISSHAKDVMDTKEFITITVSFPNLLTEAFRALAIKTAPQDVQPKLLYPLLVQRWHNVHPATFDYSNFN